MHENRETSETPATNQVAGRWAKATSRKAHANVFEESDDHVVPAKRANNVGQPATAESVEGRRSREGTVLQADHVPDTVPEPTGGWRRANGAPHPLQGQAHRTQAKSRMR